MRNRRLPGANGVPVLSSGFPMLSSIRLIVPRGSVASQALPRIHGERQRRRRATDDIRQPRQRLHDSLFASFIGRPEKIQDFTLDFETAASTAVDPENAHIHEAPYHRAALAERADPQLLPKHHAELAGRALARPVLLDFDGKGRKPRIRPAILEVDGACGVRLILDVAHTGGIIYIQQPERSDADGA